MIRDAEHFSTKMSKIEGSGDLGEYIVSLVKSKALPEDEVPAPAVEFEVEDDKEEKAEVMFDAADPVTPTHADGEEDKGHEEEGVDKKEERTEDPPLTLAPEQMEEAERKKGKGGDGSPATAEEEAQVNGEDPNEAIEKGLQPTPMDVDGKEKVRSG